MFSWIFSYLRFGYILIFNIFKFAGYLNIYFLKIYRFFGVSSMFCCIFLLYFLSFLGIYRFSGFWLYFFIYIYIYTSFPVSFKALSPLQSLDPHDASFRPVIHMLFDTPFTLSLSVFQNFESGISFSKSGQCWCCFYCVLLWHKIWF